MCISKEMKMPPKITKGRKFIRWHYPHAHSKHQKCFGITGKNYKTKIYIILNLKKNFVLNSRLTYVFLRKWVRIRQATYEIIFCPSLKNNSIFKSSQSDPFLKRQTSSCSTKKCPSQSMRMSMWEIQVHEICL